LVVVVTLLWCRFWHRHCLFYTDANKYHIHLQPYWHHSRRYRSVECYIDFNFSSITQLYFVVLLNLCKYLLLMLEFCSLFCAGMLGIIGLLDDVLIALIFFLHVAALYRSVLYLRHGGSWVMHLLQFVRFSSEMRCCIYFHLVKIDNALFCT